MDIDRRARGAAVESAALGHLLRAGLDEVAVNANFRLGELDLVMRDADAFGEATLVFVEVRYRADQAFGGGAESVDARKRRKLVRAAEMFLLAHRRLAHMPCRFDVVEAQGDPEHPEINWIRDAFRADD
ncbi:MAG TPA: YraN family protein [Xanthomonadaceae bacterium]|nr:YraN family protein [Xanthomonadaceae bacterium]